MDAATPLLAGEHRPMQSLLAFPLAPSDTPAVADTPGGLKIRAADTHGVRSSASILVSRRYASRGYQVTPLGAEDHANRITLVASDHAEVVGTLTVGFDSEEGLLVDDLFKAEAAGPIKDTKLTPRMTETAKGLWGVYAVFSVTCAAA